MAPTPAPASARSSLLRVPLVPLPDDAPLLGGFDDDDDDDLGLGVGTRVAARPWGATQTAGGRDDGGAPFFRHAHAEEEEEEEATTSGGGGLGGSYNNESRDSEEDTSTAAGLLASGGRALAAALAAAAGVRPRGGGQRKQGPPGRRGGSFQPTRRRNRSESGSGRSEGGSGGSRGSEESVPWWRGGSHANHVFTRAERAAAAEFESVDYLPPDSRVYRRWLAAQPHGRQWDRWLMMGLIGVSVGALASLLKAGIAVLSAARFRGITRLLSSSAPASTASSSSSAAASLALAWLYGAGFTALASALAAAPVILFAPAAAGAGVAEVMAALNGVVVPAAFSLRTLAAKLVSAALAVGGGLPVGAEGPMVHIGALVGGGLSQGTSTTLRATSPWFARFRNPKDKRDFVAAGTAVGIAAAFGAPIGGLLFAFEELSVPFSAALAAQIFFACVAAVLTVDTLRSAGLAAAAGGGGEGRALFGLFDGAASTVLFEVRTQLANHVASMLPAAAIGVACGLLAVAFTRAILRVALFRRDGGGSGGGGGGGGGGGAGPAAARRSDGPGGEGRSPRRKPSVRLAEVALAGALFASVAILLPLLFGCTRADCVLPALAGGDRGGGGSGGGGDPSPPSPASSRAPSAAGSLFPPPSICPVPAWASDPGGRKGGEAKWRVVDADVEPFLCGDRRRLRPTAGGAGGGDGPTGGTPPLPSSRNSTSDAAAPSYNQLATLSLLSGEGAVRRLLSRGTHRELGYLALAATAALHLCGAAWAATAPLASGLFVPMLVIGACVGRFVGLALVDLVAMFGGGSPGAPPGVFLPPSPWAWADPGAFALLGAGAFMGGVTRLTVAVAVITMEVSNDVRLLLPLLVAVLAAKTVADAGCGEPLYHGMLSVKCVPFLGPAPPRSAAPLDLVPAAAAAASPVACARERMPASSARSLLRGTPEHAGFPVVRPTPAGEVFVGMVAREHLLVLMGRAAAMAARASSSPSGAAAAAGLSTSTLPDVPYEELNRSFVSAEGRALLSEQRLAVMRGPAAELAMSGLGGGEAGEQQEAAADLPPPVSSPPSPFPSSEIDPELDLTPYINTSAPAVPLGFSLGRAYALFVTLGLRHLVVVDAHNRVRGILSRKDLLGFRLDEAAARTAAAAARAAGAEEEGEGGGAAAAAATQQQ